MEKIVVKPRKGLLVRDPKTREILAEGGETKPLTKYWRRRLRDGDVEAVEARKVSKGPAPRKGGE